MHLALAPSSSSSSLLPFALFVLEVVKYWKRRRKERKGEEVKEGGGKQSEKGKKKQRRSRKTNHSSSSSPSFHIDHFTWNGFGSSFSLRPLSTSLPFLSSPYPLFEIEEMFFSLPGMVCSDVSLKSITNYGKKYAKSVILSEIFHPFSSFLGQLLRKVRVGGVKLYWLVVVFVVVVVGLGRRLLRR